MTMRLIDVFILAAVILFFLTISRAFPQTAPSSFVMNININKNTQVILDETVNNTSFDSITLVVGRTVGVAIQANFTDCVACSGTVELLGSVDGVTFVPIPDCSAAVTDNATVLFNLPQMFFPYMRIRYTETTTSDTVINAFLSIKEGLGG